MPAKLGNSILVALVNAAPVSSTRAPSSEPRSLTTFDGFPLVPVGSISAREIKARHTFIKANQVCAYFNYSNRLLNGLGVSTEGDVLGLSPRSSADLALSAHR